MSSDTKYLVYVTQQGVTTLVSYEDVTNMTKGPQIGIEGSDEVYFLTIITFSNGVQEQQAVSESQWEFWLKENS